MSNCGSLLVGVCLTAQDWNLNIKTLRASLLNFIYVFSGACVVYVVVQGDEQIVDRSDFERVGVIFYFAKFRGVAKARNICIQQAIDSGCDYILFHDATIWWSRIAVTIMKQQMVGRRAFKFIPAFELFSEEQVCFVDSLNAKPMDKKVNPIYDPYVWSYVLPVGDIGDIRFDERIGPGDSTTFKSGEDVIFLFDFFKRLGGFWIESFQEVKVYHPPRDKLYKKHLLYAAGQGNMFRQLLRRHFSLTMCRDVTFFFANAVIRCFLLKQNSFGILLKRINGFVGRGC